MKAEHYAVACPMLAESYRLDPHAGGLFTLAECENQWGKTASAIADYDGFLALMNGLPPRDKARQADRAKVAAEKRAALAREVPSVTLSLEADVPPGSTVTIDGRAVPPKSLAALIPLDPGDHLVSVEAPDGRKADQHVTLAPRDARALTLALPPPVAAAAKAAGTAPPTVDPGASRRVPALVTAGVGAAAVVAGGVMGAIVLAQKSSIDANCPTPTTCASSGDASSANGARTLGWASTGALIGGGALLGAAAVLWFTRPSAVEPVVAPSPSGGLLGVRGTF